MTGEVHQRVRMAVSNRRTRAAVLEFLRGTAQDIFVSSTIVASIFLLMELARKGFVSYYLNVNILLIVVLVSGAISFLTAGPGPERVLSEDDKIAGKAKRASFIIGSGILSLLVACYAIAAVGSAGLLISVVAGLSIIAYYAIAGYRVSRE